MGRKDWRTPPAFFRQEWEKYHHNVDAAADDENALVRPPCDLGVCSGLYEGIVEADQRSEQCGVCSNIIGRYYTAETNGLNPEHYHQGDRVFCNPPYDHTLSQWLALASETRRRGVFWELLLQPATDTRWFHEYVWEGRFGRPREGVEVMFLASRLHFSHPEEQNDSPRGGNMVVCFWPEAMLL